MKIRLSPWLLAPFWVLPTMVGGATYFVRTDGNNSCSGLTDGAGASGNCAFRSILKGVQTAQAGDVVTVHAGDYTGETLLSSRSGSAGSLITIQAVPGDVVAISRIKITHNYVVVKGFRVTNSGTDDSAGISLVGNGCQALNNTIVGNAQPWNDGEGTNIGVWSAGDSNVISSNTWDGTANSGNSFGIGIYLDAPSSNNEIIHNTMKDINSPGRLFEIYGNHHVISGNEIRNCHNTYENDNDHVDIFQGFNTASSEITVEHNYFHDFAGQFVMFADWMVPGAIHHWTFRNNVFANIDSSAFIKSKNIYF